MEDLASYQVWGIWKCISAFMSVNITACTKHRFVQLQAKSADWNKNNKII
jgi:hypothetical protein